MDPPQRVLGARPAKRTPYSGLGESPLLQTQQEAGSLNYPAKVKITFTVVSTSTGSLLSM